MALTRKQKEELVKNYETDIKSYKNIVLLKQYWISVNEINDLRTYVYNNGWKLCVIKKRIFLFTASNGWLDEVSHDSLDGSVIALFFGEDDFSPLKWIAKSISNWKKEKKNCSLDYLWGWFDCEWKDASYVQEIANLPSKDELIWKFAFLIKYPVHSFVVAVDQISKK